jgi:hypothetical protein
MVQVHIEGTAHEVREAMRELLGSGHAVVESVKAEPKKSEKSEKKAVEHAAPVPHSAPATESKTEPAPLKIEDISAKVADLLAKHPRQKVVEFLASFDVKKGSDVPAARWAEFLTKADALK